jgi:general secretion pathway protein G
MECLTVSGSRPRGFTLIELLVVMAIIATLLLIAVPRYSLSLQRAREATLLQDLSVMRDAIDKFMGDRGHYPVALEELVEARYLRAIPQDPVTKSADTWQLVRSDDPELTGVRDVHSGADGEDISGTPYGNL